MYTPNNIKKPPVLSVSQLTRYIKSVLEGDFRLQTVVLTGEISNLSQYSKGHIYFSLKDSEALISAVMFASSARTLSFRPRDGMNVICFGRINVYEKSGRYQIIVENMQPDGVGALTMAFEQLKNDLAKKGLFDENHKKPIPRFPRTVGVITSPTGAAVQDIKNILFRRFPCVDVVMCPVLVQGTEAPAQLVNAINRLDERSLCDVIIIGRGGGSIEDLWAFNSEALAYAVYNCSIPVISAVGHETDFTICDFAADLRAPTPSAAAELAVPDKNELMAFYESRFDYINSFIDNKIRGFEKNSRMIRAQLAALNPGNTVDLIDSRHKQLISEMTNLITERLSNADGELKAAAAKLNSLNPVAVLARGYSIAEQNGKIINSAAKMKRGDSFTLTFSDGKIGALVTAENGEA